MRSVWNVGHDARDFPRRLVDMVPLLFRSIGGRVDAERRLIAMGGSMSLGSGRGAVALDGTSSWLATSDV